MIASYKVFRCLLSLVLLNIIIACSHIPKSEIKTSLKQFSTQQQQAWSIHYQKTIELTTWQLEGKIALRKGNQRHSGFLYWQQEQNNYHIDLNGPFGQGHIQLIGSTEGVTLHKADGSHVTANDAQNLLEQVTGAKVPLAELIWWIKGMPAPNKEIKSLQFFNPYTQQPLIRQLSQSTWEIEYLNYMSVGTLYLPKKLKLKYEPYEITLFIRQWHSLKNH